MIILKISHKGVDIMFLAIRGNINAVFKLQKPDILTIEKYLLDIQHETFQKKTKAYKYINVDVVPKNNDNHFQFQECIRTLKAKNVIPKEDNITAFSSTQNIEDDIERNQVYAQKKLETKLNKARTVLEDNNSIIIDKNYKTTFATDISDISTIHNAIEINNDIIESDLFASGMRQSLLEYVRAGGNKNVVGIFKGKVSRITHNAILFEKLTLHFKNLNGDFETKFEIHIWIPDCEEFRKIEIQEGDCVQFKAIAYFYQRQNGTVDISLKAPHLIKFIKKYRLPK